MRTTNSEMVRIDDHHVYKVLTSDSTELACNIKLNHTGLIPKILRQQECHYEGDPMMMITMEHYDGTYSKQPHISKAMFLETMSEIIRKSILLNNVYKICHGDFHQENIMYKQTSSGIKWAFIDFERSIMYDHNNRPIKSDRNMKLFNPLFDLGYLMTHFHPKYHVSFDYDPEQDPSTLTGKDFDVWIN